METPIRCESIPISERRFAIRKGRDGTLAQLRRSTAIRDHTKAFCRIAAETFECPGPIFEFGSYQVEGQLDYADLRSLFPNVPYVGCDMRAGPGVDRVEDVTRMTLKDGEAGTILCIETFEHVFEVHRAFDEVFRALKPGGLFLITSPFHFKIHGYPDDYWRMTPSCLSRMMERYEARVCGYQGHDKTPHTVMALGFKAPAPANFAENAARFIRSYQAWLKDAEANQPASAKIKRLLGRIRRSKGERRQIACYHQAELRIEQGSGIGLAAAG